MLLYSNTTVVQWLASKVQRKLHVIALSPSVDEKDLLGSDEPEGEKASAKPRLEQPVAAEAVDAAAKKLRKEQEELNNYN